MRGSGGEARKLASSQVQLGAPHRLQSSAIWRFMPRLQVGALVGGVEGADEVDEVL